MSVLRPSSSAPLPYLCAYFLLLDRSLSSSATGPAAHESACGGQDSSCTSARDLNDSSMNRIEELLLAYGSDKVVHRYARAYDVFLSHRRDQVNLVLEIGIGSLDVFLPGNMFWTLDPKLVLSASTSRYVAESGFDATNYTPGGSLRAWRDFFPRARVIGCDVDEKVLFAEERLQTYKANSMVPSDVRMMMKAEGIDPNRGQVIDFIVDDGCHAFECQIATLKNMWPYLRVGGVYSVEDVDAKVLPFFTEFLISRKVVFFIVQLNLRSSAIILVRSNSAEVVVALSDLDQILKRFYDTAYDDLLTNAAIFEECWLPPYHDIKDRCCLLQEKECFNTGKNKFTFEQCCIPFLLDLAATG